MGLVKCAKCGKEISSKTYKCIHCGHVKLGNSKLLIVIIILIVMSFVCVISNRTRLEKTEKLLEQGGYQEAKKLLANMQYSNRAEELLNEIEYEELLFKCISAFIVDVKYPSTFKVQDVMFFESLTLSGTEEKNIKMVVNEMIHSDYPVCVIKFSAQNAYGAEQTSYYLLSYSKKEDKFCLIGRCDSLDVKSYTSDEEEELELLTCKVINLYIDNGTRAGSVNIDRVQRMVDSGKYTKIIEN